MIYTATYSPDDNKLRLYSVSRLDAETFKRLREAGFIRAPKQDLYVAPMWTPEREDLLLDLAGEIGDDDTSLVERAEQRAERFEQFSGRRAEDAASEQRAVSAIFDHIPLGQPILVGHHSEKRARRDQARIDSGIRRAARMWEKAHYWQLRAAGAVRHALHKERPDVRARRIRTIEADQRRAMRAIDHVDASLKALSRSGLTFEMAFHFAAHAARNCFNLRDELRRNPGEYRAICERHVADLERSRERYERWFAHYENRLAYERAMLEASGYVEPPKRASKLQPPLLNYSGDISYRNPWRENEPDTAAVVPMTRVAWAALHNDYKGTRLSADGTHRVRVAMVQHRLVPVFLVDAKEHPRPGGDSADGEKLGLRE